MTGDRIRLAADIGGTFTDVAAISEDGSQIVFGKALSTPENMVQGIADSVEKAQMRISDAELFLHGSTVAINTLLERTGARTALLTTEGFRDAYEIGRINRPDAYNLFFRKHVPLIRRSLRFEIRERVMADGTIHIPLDRDQVEALCDRLEQLEIDAVAIVLFHCYVDPTHEKAVKEIVRRRLPNAFVSASHELSQEYREFERTSTTAANAYIGPKVRDYLAGIDRHLGDSGFGGSFLVVQSTGGLFEVEQAKSECIRVLESGPAAGVIGARTLCSELNLENAIAFDMGGTTAKAGVIYRNEVLTATMAMVGGYNEGLPVQMPLVDVFEVGTGGGSIAAIDVGGGLTVGPRSAGAVPGPACYGRGGTQPTVTDANLVLGRLATDQFLGGELTLDLPAAREVIDRNIGKPLALSLEEAAAGIIQIAVTKMSYAVKGVSTERGLDAASFALIAYGGAGPLHASAIAREIGIRQVIVPHSPGHFCAFGMLNSDLRYDNVRTWLRPLEQVAFDEIREIFDDLAGTGKIALARSGVTPLETTTGFAADMRYVGQEHPVTVDLPESVIEDSNRDALKAAFDNEHHRRYGTNAPEEPAEIVSLRAYVIGRMPSPRPQRLATGARQPEHDAHSDSRRVYFGISHGWLETPVLQRIKLLAGNVVNGPALIEEYASTTVVLPGDRMEVDHLGNLMIAVGVDQ